MLEQAVLEEQLERVGDRDEERAHILCAEFEVSVGCPGELERAGGCGCILTHQCLGAQGRK